MRRFDGYDDLTVESLKGKVWLKVGICESYV